jgi:hypothetical protein
MVREAEMFVCVIVCAFVRAHCIDSDRERESESKREREQERERRERERRRGTLVVFLASEAVGKCEQRKAIRAKNITMPENEKQEEQTRTINRLPNKQ